MEKSRARERLRRDLSAPWLRHSSRDDGWGHHPPVISTEPEGRLEKSSARETRDLSTAVEMTESVYATRLAASALSRS